PAYCDMVARYVCVVSSRPGRIVTIGLAVFFFFQAEDGIRDRNVTGVQTCALPIYAAISVRRSRPDQIEGAGHLARAHARRRSRRSEERRVGKECRSRWSTEHKKKKETRKTDKEEKYGDLADQGHGTNSIRKRVHG